MPLHPIKTPAFEELPLVKDGAAGNAWGRFGDKDQLGMLNLLTPEVVAAAASSEIKTGVRVSLDWSMNKPYHPSFGRQQFAHRIHHKAPRCVNDDIVHFNTQGSSQWDGLRHYANQKHKKFYNGVTQQDIESSGVLGTDVMVANGGIVGRGVLIDYASWADANNIKLQPFESAPIPLAHLQQIVKEQNITFKQGDILFVRSGFIRAYDSLSTDEQKALSVRESHSFQGVEAGKATFKWLWEHQFSALAGDAVAWERAPPGGSFNHPDEVLHEWVLAGWGMPIGEMFDLEALAKQCKETGRHSFFLSSMPLNVPGGVASPPNAVAIF